MPRLYIYTLKCHEQEDVSGCDNPYLARVEDNSEQTIWGPIRVCKKWIKPVNVFQDFDDAINIKLLEKDYDSPDDDLGTHTAHASDVDQGEQTWMYTGDDAKYEVKWEVKAQ